MPHGKSDSDYIAHERNTARFFTENRQIAWVLLIATVVWGVYAYSAMPKRKDPEVPVHVAAALCLWPGASAEKVEQLVTRKMEQKIAENASVTKIESDSRSSVSVIHVELDESIADPGKQFDDINFKLNSISDLPQGAGPIQFIKDFGDTAALMLTVSSPKADSVEIALRAKQVRAAIEAVRKGLPDVSARSAGVVCYPMSISPQIPREQRDLFLRYAAEMHSGRDLRPIDGPGFTGVDGIFGPNDRDILAFIDSFFRERLRPSEKHPDLWDPAIIRNPADTEARLAAVASDRYSYRELDDFTDLIQRTLETVPLVSKVSRSGVLKQKIFLEYSQERLASYGVQQSSLSQILSARNITLAGGRLEVGDKNLMIDPSGEFKSEKEIGDVLITTSPSGAPVYLRDGVDILRAYDSPPQYLNFYNWRDSAGAWHRTRAITLSVQMRSGEQIAEFGKAVDAALESLKARLPSDLILARTSDQPLQVEENIELFMRSLYEAIALVVLVALLGFWEWRSAVLMALSIPITLAMTFGMMNLLGLDVQQVSIASLIIALGLLVDDPVVAGDSMKRELSAGHPRGIAAWLGPTKLAHAIMFATITNIVAYLPMLLLKGDIGRFIYSLPVVLGCSLVASRLVSMTFIPLLGYYLLRPPKKAEPPMEERRRHGFASVYYSIGDWALEHRKMVFLFSVLVLAVGGYFLRDLKQQFFPKDLSYLSYVDVWLPEDATFAATNATAARAETFIRAACEQYGRETPDKEGKPRDVLQSVTTFIGGGGPRFWFSVVPEIQQLNYAQLIIQVKDKHDTNALIAPLQHALSAGVAGARVDVRQLETGKPVGIPVSVRISGGEMAELRRLAEQVKGIFRAIPDTDRTRDDWGAESFSVKLQVDPDRANLAGISNLDVALSSASGMSGYPVSTLREGKEQIPIVTRLRPSERAQLSDIQSLYVYSTHGPQKVPLESVSTIAYNMETEKILRRNQFRTVTVSCFPVPGTLPSTVMQQARPALMKFASELPIGYKMEIGGEEEEQVKGFKQMAVVMAISVLLIFLALVFQFQSAVKPIIVFAAIPYGMVGALAALRIMGTAFGFMAFLGVASLVGVIVSHVIVLFDFIEERHEHGESLREALLDAGIIRLRPVLITVGATVFGLFPLAAHGGPLWEPMCYAQIGGLGVATFITLLLVPVIYAIFVLDLKIVKWKKVEVEPPGKSLAEGQ
jgi:multidrug efflux pump subunit AcrB